MNNPQPTDPTRRRTWRGDAPRLPDPRMIPRRPEPPRPATSGSGSAGTTPEPAGGQGGDGNEATFVRPFYLTGGRTQPVHDGLKLHTVITAPPSALHAPLRFELRQIVQLCQDPRSVAEVAAALAVPVGVARVLIADLLSGGFVACHEQDEVTLSVETIERIVKRVRAL